jgi:hypothetical protein
MITSAKSLALAVTLLIFSTVLNSAFAKCSHATNITNDSGITLTFSELKSASSIPPAFKSQWKGSRVIASGKTGIIKWTSDAHCKDNTGVDNHWDVKFIRKDGHVHSCSGLGASQPVKINTPDLCFPN